VLAIGPDRCVNEAMRIVVLGGTRFIGRAVVAALVDAGHDVTVVHHGLAEPADLPPLDHVHLDRSALTHRDLPGGVEAVVDVSAETGAQSAVAIAATPGARRVVLSSGDVYRAFASLHNETVTDPVPLTEDAPLRTERGLASTGGCENLDVEAAYLPAGAVALRLGAVYGPHDYQRRHESVLRRLRAGRTRIPIGAGTFLFSHVYVDDVAKAVLLALTGDGLGGRAFNIAEPVTPSVELRIRRTIAAVDGAAGTELVRVPDAALPPDLRLTAALGQHLLMSSARFTAETGWRCTDPDEALGRSVRWHLAHPPTDAGDDFTADDAALRRASNGSPTADDAS
jgi:nucleoside-diphosphate-sugar epimerase